MNLWTGLVDLRVEVLLDQNPHNYYSDIGNNNLIHNEANTISRVVIQYFNRFTVTHHYGLFQFILSAIWNVGTKCVSKHQDLQMLSVKLNKYE